MKLEDIGYNDKLEKYRIENDLGAFDIGRVVAEHKERYMVRTINTDIEAEITGNMRFTAKSREDFPAVGDWVSLVTYNSDFAVIHSIFPRSSVIKRRSAGQSAEVQLIAANIDYALLVQAVDRDFSINRLERYLTICYDSGVRPVIVLSKTDLAEEDLINEMIRNLNARIRDVPVLRVSNVDHSGLDALKKFIKKGKTYCMLGSSGVGKSSLLNNLAGEAIMATGSISESTHKGKHVTSRRELIILENGGIIIDNPGMREVGIADAGHGLGITFNSILKYSRNCKYQDCTHTHETGCAVIEAVKKGEIDRASYQNYLKMEKEKAHYESTVAERHQRDRKFGKMIKRYKKDMRDNN